MIRQVEIDRCEDVENLLQEYLLSIDENQRPPGQFMNDIIEHWQNRRIEIFAKFDESDCMQGIAVLGMVSNRISIIHASGKEKTPDEIDAIRTELFDKSFEMLRSKGNWIITGSGVLEGSLRSYAIKTGFERFERAFMTLDRKTLEDTDDRELPPEYSFHPFDDSLKGSITELIFESTEGSIDVGVFPNFFSTKEYVRQLVENTIQNRFGEFRSPDDSRILMRNGRVVGVCLITIRNDYGYIPDICIDPALKRRGLGRAMLVHTLKRLMKVYDDLKGVNLDVTLENPARHLYESLGFEEQGRYDIINWLKL